jgi:anti-sigma factor RsiW
LAGGHPRLEIMMEHPSGWTCEEIKRQLEAYLRSTLPHGKALAVAEHLEACAGCAQRLVLHGQTRRG